MGSKILKITVSMLFLNGILLQSFAIEEEANRTCSAAWQTDRDVNLSCAFSFQSANTADTYISWYYNNELIGLATKSHNSKLIVLKNGQNSTFEVLPLGSSVYPHIKLIGNLLIKDYNNSRHGYSIYSELTNLIRAENYVDIESILEDKSEDTSPDATTTPKTEEKPTTIPPPTMPSVTEVKPTRTEIPQMKNLFAQGFATGISVGVILTGVILSIVFYFCFWRKRDQQRQQARGRLEADKHKAEERIPMADVAENCQIGQ